MSARLLNLLTSLSLVVALAGCRGLGESKGSGGDRAEPVVVEAAVDAGVVVAPSTVAATGPRACASTSECAAGERCTVEDGVCNRPPNCGPSDVCAEVCYGTCAAPRDAGTAGVAAQVHPTEQPHAPTPTGGACKKDADCRTFSDYCTGCDCRALAPGEGEPKCKGPGVRCLVDPCMRKHAACVAGRCAVAIGAASTAPTE